MIITILFLTFEHKRLFENHLAVNRSSMNISYQNNFLTTVLTILMHFKQFLTVLMILWSPRLLLSVRSCVVWRPVI